MPVYTRPSSGLLEALVSLTTSGYRLGLSRQVLQEKRVLRTVLEGLSQNCLRLVDVETLQLSAATSQRLWDMFFLKTLCQQIGVQEIGKDNINRIHAQVSRTLVPLRTTDIVCSWSP